LEFVKLSTEPRILDTKIDRREVLTSREEEPGDQDAADSCGRYVIIP
jgi:hypothetical protein